MSFLQQIQQLQEEQASSSASCSGNYTSIPCQPYSGHVRTILLPLDCDSLSLVFDNFLMVSVSTDQSNPKLVEVES